MGGQERGLMEERSGEGKERDRDYEILEERISYLEHLKSFHGEILKLTRVYTSNENFTSKRCLQEIVNFIQRRFTLHLVCVLLRDEITEELVTYVASGEAPELDSIRQRRVRDGEGILGKSANTGETVVIGDVANSPDAHPYATA